MAVKVADLQQEAFRLCPKGRNLQSLCSAYVHLYIRARVHGVCRCADVQVLYVLTLTYPSPGLRQDPLMIYHCVCQASQSVSFQGVPLLCLPNGYWIPKMTSVCYSVHLQMALGSQTQVCLTH